MPNYHNPGGINLSVERRKKLAELAYEYNFFILEDDAYVELSFTGKYLPSIYSFGPKRVIYFSTFSKIIAPGIRMGWAITDPAIINKMRMLKSDGATSVYVQEVIGRLLDRFDFDGHLAKLVSCYEARKEAMTKAIHEFFDERVTYSIPNGGFFLWLTFPPAVDTSAFLQQSVDKGVSYIDGRHFYLQGSDAGANHLRLCFTFCNEQQIREGIRSIANAYYAYLKMTDFKGSTSNFEVNCL
jgi:2-aminoadipate transaminase